jgi:integrase
VGTFGLPKAIHPMANWTQQLGLDTIFNALLDATKTDRYPEFVGTIVQFLRQQDASIHLADWSDELPCAWQLRRFFEACSVSPFVASTYPAMPSLKLVSQQLTGGLLTKLATVALVARPIPVSEEVDRQWIAALRTWVFLQTVDAVFRGGRPNRYLLDVTNKLRLAIDRDEEWLALFARLRGSIASFHGITRHLAAASSRLLVDKTVQSSVHRLLLATLRNFCEDKTPESKDSEGQEDHGRFLRFLEQKSQQSPYFLPPNDPERLTEPDDDDPAQHAEQQGLAWNFDPPGAEESVIAVVTVEETRTPLEQDHQARGILLATAEDHQFFPYSWNRPSPSELAHLDQWINSTLAGDDFTLRVLATFVEIAIQSANSLETILPLSLSAIAGSDWSIDMDQGDLHRLPPRRYNGWHVTTEATAWVEPIAGTSRIPLPPAAARTLQRLLADAPVSTQLGNLWPASIGVAPSTIFNRTCRQTKGLERLRSGMLAKILEQQVFETSGDPVLSQLLASHPRSGLGGACAYASYQHGQVKSLLTRVTPNPTDSPTDSIDSQSNAAGSELSPLDAALRQSCDEALAKVNLLATQSDRWIEYHNALTAYVVVVLLAATGARPVSSPFESLDYFDWLTRTLYIEDKVSSKLHQGRLVPIPDWVALLVQDCYLPHLARLAVLLSQIDAPFSEELTQISQGISSERLPLFFLLRMEPQLRWFEVSETTLSALEVFSWPLPWNLMRHRLPTTLKRAGQDHECINGITGHGEHGTAPHGPYSMRVWQDDAEQMRQPLTDALIRLNLQTPTAPQWLACPVALEVGSTLPSCLAKEHRFGSSARNTRRQANHQQATQQAQTDILQFVAGRPIDSLTPGEWETLSQQMLLHVDGRPRTLGTIRYEALQQWIAQNWLAKGLRPRIKRRYLPSLEEQSPFTVDAIGCQERIGASLAFARRIAQSVPPSRRSQRESLAVGIILLVLESRIGDPAVIKDLLQNKNFRLVLFQQRYHLEHSAGLDKVADVPVRRYGLSETTAILLAKAKATTYNLDVRKWPVADRFRDIGQPFGFDARQFTSLQTCVLAIAAHVRQANALQYPGLITAYLNGDIVSAGLRHADWVRVMLGKAVIFAQPEVATDGDAGSGAESEDSDEDDNEPPSELMDDDFIAWPDAFMRLDHEKVTGPPNIPQLQQDSVKFFQKIRDALNAELRSKTPSRRDLDSKLRTLISENKRLVSRSCLLLGEWQRSLLWRKTGKGLIRIRSLTRYLNALSVCFQAMAYDHDLLACDEEDVTEFYQKVMEIRQSVRPGLSPATDPASPPLKPTEEKDVDKEAATHYRSQSLALQLLKDFHRLMSREFGVEDPDWSEISVTDELLSISPGMLTEKEYHCALVQLAPKPAQASREDLARAFILLMTYRFGLRGAEATGLHRSDWVDDQPEALVVLVRGNRLRRLKTAAAQRQVPLLFVLTDHEKELVTNWLISWESITILNGAGPLFADQKSPDQLMNGKLLRRDVSEVIKQVTQNADLSLHHARHSFCNQVALLLMAGTGDIWPHASTPEQSTARRQNHVRRLLLSTNRVTRRSLWALARLLGHAHPNTTVRSYLHLLPDLARHYVNLPVVKKRLVHEELDIACIDLDRLPYAENYLEPIPRDEVKTVTRRPLTADLILRFLHLYQRGVADARAQLVVGISSEDARHLIQGLEQIDRILARRPAINQSLGGSSNLLSHIPQARWADLITRAHDVTWEPKPQIGPVMGIDELPLIVGPSRQIVLWKPLHFRLFKKIVDCWALSETSYSMWSTVRGQASMQDMATQAGLVLTPATGSQANESFQQIDPVETGDPPMLVRHRCGVLARTHTDSAFRSSHELVLLVLVSMVLQGRSTGQVTEDLNGMSGR